LLQATGSPSRWRSSSSSASPWWPFPPRLRHWGSVSQRVRLYGADGYLADAHYRESSREHLSPHGLDHIDAPAGRDGKTEVYLNAKKLIHERRVRIPNHPRLLTQLRQIVSRPAPGGGVVITSPRRKGGGGHGDLASAFVLALWAARNDDGGADWDVCLNAWAKGGYVGAEHEKKPPIVVIYHPGGMHEAYGNPPRFTNQMRVHFTHANDEGRFSAAATFEFRAAVRGYRMTHNIL